MRGTRIPESEFDRLLSSFQRSAFRLETYDMYALDYEAVEYQRFLAGHPTPPPHEELRGHRTSA